jgi:spermidine/putrescine transport system permease protein
LSDWRRHPLFFALLVAPALLWLVLFFLAPLASIFLLSFSEQTSLTDTALTWQWGNYAKALDPLYLKVMGYSLWIALLTTIFCLVIGYPVALAVAFAPAKWRPVLLLLVILPFWTNLLVRTYALKSTIGGSSPISAGAEWIYNLLPGFLTGGAPYPGLVFNDLGVVIGLVYVHLPFMVLPLYTALEKLDRTYLEASLDLGAGQWLTFRKVMVPLTMPAIIAGGIITFIPAFGALVTPALLGGTDSLMIGNLIDDQIKRANNWPLGSALSMLLVYATFAILALQSWYSQRQERHAELRK